MSNKPVSLKDGLARHTHQSKAAAADTVDRIVHEIVSKLRAGKPAKLPGMGIFEPGSLPDIRFVPAPSGDAKPRRRK